MLDVRPTGGGEWDRWAGVFAQGLITTWQATGHPASLPRASITSHCKGLDTWVYRSWAGSKEMRAQVWNKVMTWVALDTLRANLYLLEGVVNFCLSKLNPDWFQYVGRSPRRGFLDHDFMLHCTILPHLLALCTTGPRLQRVRSLVAVNVTLLILLLEIPFNFQFDMQCADQRAWEQ